MTRPFDLERFRLTDADLEALNTKEALRQAKMTPEQRAALQQDSEAEALLEAFSDVPLGKA